MEEIRELVKPEFKSEIKKDMVLVDGIHKEMVKEKK